jgi:hypothetical protein
VADVRVSLVGGDSMRKRIFTRENLYAVIFCLLLIAIIIFTADKAPLWIYQGF